VVGLWLLSRRPAWGKRLLALDLLLIYALSIPPVAHLLKASLEAYPPLTRQQIETSGAGAIVVLGAGAYEQGADYGAASPYPSTLIRARYAGWLQRLTGLPVFVAGGGEKGAEAYAMQAVLLELGAPPEKVWIETASRNTQQNAQQTAEFLAPRGIRKVLLVTQAWHMRRSVWIFEKAGLDVVPAPCEPAQHSMYSRGVFQVLPQLDCLYHSSVALEEWLANVFYTLRY